MKKNKLKCPCCKGEVYSSAAQQTLKLSPQVWFWIDKYELVLENLQRDEDTFQWACDDCLNSQKAIIANPEIQTYCDYPPYLAYFDIEKKCTVCGENYIFSAEEQKFWYEELKFFVQGESKSCVKCRQKKRHKNNLTSELSSLLKDKHNLNQKQLLRIAEIYGKLGRVDKQTYFIRLATKAQDVS
ncbi:MAG: zinc-ribbon domain-containing protein [Thermoflexibacter sp.]|jgi:hypothetical protein|nr:zinc-ribbon domain-containing protein [Thermoflexibacter sp.]